MILLGIITGLAVAYGVIVTGLLVATQKIAENYQDSSSVWHSAYLDEKDRNQSSSLSEYSANRRVAMPALDLGPVAQYGYDQTGLVRGVIDADE